jgi:hypothetical protein
MRVPEPTRKDSLLYGEINPSIPAFQNRVMASLKEQSKKSLFCEYDAIASV